MCEIIPAPKKPFALCLSSPRTRFLKTHKKPQNTPSFGSLERFLVSQWFEWVLSAVENQLIFVTFAVAVIHGGHHICNCPPGLGWLRGTGGWRFFGQGLLNVMSKLLVLLGLGLFSLGLGWLQGLGLR